MYALTNQLCETFRLLEQTLASDAIKYQHGVKNVQAIIKSCLSGIGHLEAKLKQIESQEPRVLLPERRQLLHSLKASGKKLLYPFRKDTLAGLRCTITELRDNLGPALQALNMWVIQVLG
jgi:hypothetical protein